VRSFVTDLAEESTNAATIAALGQLTAQHDDAASMFLMGKTALARDHYAFPAAAFTAWRFLRSTSCRTSRLRPQQRDLSADRAAAGVWLPRSASY
jgi:hypothetical protein